jgi:hypothetical protein
LDINTVQTGKTTRKKVRDIYPHGKPLRLSRIACFTIYEAIPYKLRFILEFLCPSLGDKCVGLVQKLRDEDDQEGQVVKGGG